VDLTLLAYVIMSSHIHWATLAGRDPASRFILPVHGPFGRWLNIRQCRSGHVFMERFRTLVFEGELIADLLAYIHNNPVRAGVVSDPADSSWSSHRAYIGDQPAPPWLNVELGLSLAGFDASTRGRLAFHDYVRSRAGLPRSPEFSGATLDDDRAAVRRVLGPGVEAGSGVVTRDRAGVEIVARPDATVLPLWEGTALDLLRVVGELTGLSLDTICSRSRRPRVVRARRLAMLVWARFLSRPQTEMLALLGRSSACGSKLLSRDDALAELANDARELAAHLAGTGPRIAQLADGKEDRER
jgi:putative transposase